MTKKEIFEIHITGDESILEAGKQLSLKTIAVELARPDLSILRTEYMTSQDYECNNYEECKKYVDEIEQKLRDMGVNIIRVDDGRDETWKKLENL